MNKLLILILASTIALTSCDGRDRVYKTNAEVLHESHLLNAFSQQIKFVPERSIKIETDTILSNGFQVKIKYHSVENNSILKTVKTKNDTITKVHYKNFEAKLEVLKNGKTINKSSISKVLFNEFENTSFWTNAIMQYIWIDHEASTKNKLYLNTSFHIPNTESYKDFILKMDEYGSIQIKESNLSTKII
ncbi:hypothetical protein GCM10023314_16790 [Algibacter agarivorans]|uniref:Lipoprotein n=1 Tax=Algibacter agarivorans TaxID=1109741 RepID=A0ABP9GHV7_9FLAO